MLFLPNLNIRLSLIHNIYIYIIERYKICNLPLFFLSALLSEGPANPAAKRHGSCGLKDPSGCFGITALQRHFGRRRCVTRREGLNLHENPEDHSMLSKFEEHAWWLFMYTLYVYKNIIYIYIHISYIIYTHIYIYISSKEHSTAFHGSGKRSNMWKRVTS